MVKASASGAVEFDLIPSRVKPMTIKLLFTAFLFETQHERKCAINMPANLFVPFEKHLAGFPHVKRIETQPVTPKRDRYGALIVF